MAFHELLNSIVDGIPRTTWTRSGNPAKCVRTSTSPANLCHLRRQSLCSQEAWKKTDRRHDPLSRSAWQKKERSPSVAIAVLRATDGQGADVPFLFQVFSARTHLPKNSRNAETRMGWLLDWGSRSNQGKRSSRKPERPAPGFPRNQLPIRCGRLADVIAGTAANEQANRFIRVILPASS